MPDAAQGEQPAGNHLLDRILTHLDVLPARFAYKDKDESSTSAVTEGCGSVLHLLTKGTVAKGLEPLLRDVVSTNNLTKLVGVVHSKEAELDSLGFGPKIATTEPRTEKGQKGGGKARAKGELIRELLARYARIAAKAEQLRSELDSLAPPALQPYPLSVAAMKEAMAAANATGNAPGVLEDLRGARDFLSAPLRAKLSLVASFCVSPDPAIPPPAVPPGGLVPPYAPLPALTVNMQLLDKVLRLVYADSCSDKKPTAGALPWMPEVVWWVLFCSPSQVSWAAGFNKTEEYGMALSMDKSESGPTSDRALGVAAYNKIPTQELADQIATAAIAVFRRCPRVFVPHIVPSEIEDEDESLRAHFMQVCTDAPTVTLDAITATMTARCGPISRRLQNYSVSGQDADNPPYPNFVTDLEEGSKEMAMHCWIMYALIELGGGILKGEHLLWNVLLRLTDEHTGSGDPNVIPSVAEPKGGKGLKGGGAASDSAKLALKAGEDAAAAAASARAYFEQLESDGKLQCVRDAIKRKREKCDSEGLSEGETAKLAKLEKLEAELCAQADDALVSD